MNPVEDDAPTTWQFLGISRPHDEDRQANHEGSSRRWRRIPPAMEASPGGGSLTALAQATTGDGGEPGRSMEAAEDLSAIFFPSHTLLVEADAAAIARRGKRWRRRWEGKEEVEAEAELGLGP
jgi:hypothetical protein